MPVGDTADNMASERVVVRGEEITAAPTVTRVDVRSRRAELHEVLNGRAANLIIHNAGASSFNDVYAIRGLGNPPNFSKAAVTLYVDDVPTGSTFTNFPQLLGVSSFEVFRGPHGERFGKNSEAGVINMIVDPPTNDGDASASLRIGSYDLFGAQAHVAGPLVNGRVFASVSISHVQRDGYLHNTFLDTYPDDLEQTAARVALRFTPSAE